MQKTTFKKIKPEGVFREAPPDTPDYPSMIRTRLMQLAAHTAGCINCTDSQPFKQRRSPEVEFPCYDAQQMLKAINLYREAERALHPPI